VGVHEPMYIFFFLILLSLIYILVTIYTICLTSRFCEAFLSLGYRPTYLEEGEFSRSIKLQIKKAEE